LGLVEWPSHDLQRHFHRYDDGKREWGSTNSSDYRTGARNANYAMKKLEARPTICPSFFPAIDKR
jgi:hypothetical protein